MMEHGMSDKADDILKSLGKLSPSDMRLIIENLASQSGGAEKWPTPALDKLAHLPNRLSCEDIIDRASISDKYTYWHIEDGDFDTMVDFRDASTAELAVKFAYDPQELQPWYSKHALDPQAQLINKSLAAGAKQVSSKEFRAWIRKE
jgi:hypothetical protein